jgi:hypothetical protein
LQIGMVLIASISFIADSPPVTPGAGQEPESA